MFGRAQTEAIGVVAVTAVVLLLATTVGFAVVESMAVAESTASTIGDYRFDADGTAVSVTHAGGDSVPLSDLSLIVRGPNGSTSHPFSAGTLAGGGSAFRPGTTWRYDASPFPFDRAVELDLLVVHGPSGTVVDRATVGVGPAPTATPTATATPTPTPTPTATPTATPTPAPPEVRSFEATNPRRKVLRVTLVTDRRLSALRVVVRRGEDGRAVGTLHLADFTESGEGPYTYVATTTVDRSGTSRVVLETAAAADGPDAAAGQVRRVHVNGGDGNWWDDWWSDRDGGWWGGGDGWNWWPW